MVSPVVGQRHRRLYVVVAVLLALWALALLALNLPLIPDTYWYSYYAIDYSLGFLRRGLAGELVVCCPARTNSLSSGWVAGSRAWLSSLRSPSWLGG